jgi:hypothetical protein
MKQSKLDIVKIKSHFLYGVMASQGNREQLVINFAEQFDYKIC